MFFFFFNNHADELREVAESDEIKAVIESEEYYFQKAIDKYIQYKEINVSEDILKQLIEQAETKPFSYEKWLSSYSKETKEYKMLKIIGELVSYIDRNASMKNKLNEYDDKRTMALAYVRQNVWLKNFIKLKLDGNLQNITEIIGNAIKYIENPDKVICVFKEQRKLQIYKSIFDGQDGNLFECMKELGIKSKNPMNDGYVYSLILHSKKIKELWDKGNDIPEHMHEGTVNLDSEEAGEVGKIYTELYIKNDFLNDVFISEKQYDTLEILLKRKKNIILQGAPGVGKTYAAKRLAYSIMGKKDDSCIKLIQFHQSYSYEDFIMGYRPDDRGFSIRYGTFYEFQKKAKENPDKKFFLIIDEINRGNLSKIFGELFMLIEADKRGEKIVLTYNDEEFYVPKNLYIIGTMNTADRSLAIIDYALRRRFCFFELVPAFATQEFKQYLLGNNVDKDLIEKIIIRFSHLNSEIEKDPNLGSGFRIGHSYFCDCSATNELWYETIIKYEIAPLLEEYWFDDIENAKNHIEELLR